MVDHESQGDVQFDEKALARVMGRAYADDAYREVLTSSPSETLEQAGEWLYCDGGPGCRTRGLGLRRASR